MGYLFDKWDKIKNELRKRFLFLFLDYDGTLTPIVDLPEKAVISDAIRKLLRELSCAPECKLAIISGRALDDIINLVGIKDIIYVGNHGLEIKSPKIKFESPIPLKTKSIIRRIYDELYNRLSGIKGIFIEDKRLTISVHYRLVDKRDVPMLLNILTEITMPFVSEGKIRITTGKKVYEIRPPVEWDKGKVVLWLLARQKFILKENNMLPIYLGDDATDEDAFRVLKNKGLSVFMGKPGASRADFYLKNTEDLVRFMKRILELKKA
jgi:trehalose-phosphatase